MPELDDKTINRWKKVRVFISSTFCDMHTERDYLRKTQAIEQLTGDSISNLSALYWNFLLSASLLMNDYYIRSPYGNRQWRGY